MNIFDAGSEVFDIFESVICGDREGRAACAAASVSDLRKCLDVDCVKKHGSEFRDESLERMHAFAREQIASIEFIENFKKTHNA